MQQYNINSSDDNRKNQLTFLVRYKKNIHTLQDQLENLYDFNKNRNPDIAKKIQKDLTWVKKNKELHKIDKSRKKLFN